MGLTECCYFKTTCRCEADGIVEAANLEGKSGACFEVQNVYVGGVKLKLNRIETVEAARYILREKQQP